jgi:hypothetical protein
MPDRIEPLDIDRLRAFFGCIAEAEQKRKITWSVLQDQNSWTPDYNYNNQHTEQWD